MIPDPAVTRNVQLKKFVDLCFNNGETKIIEITGDAGHRNYFRVNNLGSSYILMDCPKWYCSVEPFIKIAQHLFEHNISAPKIFYQNIDEGFLLLEDLGNISIKKYIENQDTVRISKEIYFLIIDLLIEIQKLPLPLNLASYHENLLINELELFTTWYVPYKTGKELSKFKLITFRQVWKRALLHQKTMNPTIVLRDFHVENMMYLPYRAGIHSIGVLDFQDALFGSPIYDLVSVLEDARIKVPRDLALDCLEYYSCKTGLDLTSVSLNYHVLGAQRNLRILGVFAKKFICDKDDRYLQYMPLVLEYLKFDLSHLALVELKSYLSDILYDN